MTTDSTWQLTSLLSSHSCCPITGLDALMPWVDIYILSHQWFWVRAYLVGQKLISVIVRLLPRVGTGSACNDKGWRCRCLTSNGSSCITTTTNKISLADEKGCYRSFHLKEIEDRSNVQEYVLSTFASCHLLPDLHIYWHVRGWLWWECRRKRWWRTELILNSHRWPPCRDRMPRKGFLPTHPPDLLKALQWQYLQPLYR